MMYFPSGIWDAGGQNESITGWRCQSNVFCCSGLVTKIVQFLFFVISSARSSGLSSEEPWSWVCQELERHGWIVKDHMISLELHSIFLQQSCEDHPGIVYQYAWCVYALGIFFSPPFSLIFSVYINVFFTECTLMLYNRLFFTRNVVQ